MKRQCVRSSLVLSLMLVLAACTKTESANPDMPHAVVALKDGTTVSGVVVSNTPTGLTINPDAGGTRNIPMNQVKSITYGDAAAAPVSSAKAAPPEPREPRSHPEREAIRTKTFEVPAGTEV